MRIRSPALYRHIRKRNILPLPSMPTINNHLKFLRPAYGFQKTLFEAMREKSKELLPEEKRGMEYILQEKL
jgi:hypothetical protein